MFVFLTCNLFCIIFFFGLCIELSQRRNSFSETFKCHTGCITSHSLMFLIYIYVLKLLKILYWIYCNCKEICIIEVSNFTKSHNFSSFCMLNCCQNLSKTYSLGSIFECLIISNKAFLKTLSEIQHSSLQIKIKNIEQLSVLVKLRY